MDNGFDPNLLLQIRTKNLAPPNSIQDQKMIETQPDSDFCNDHSNQEHEDFSVSVKQIWIWT
jgi:hypothetical protein